MARLAGRARGSGAGTAGAGDPQGFATNVDGTTSFEQLCDEVRESFPNLAERLSEEFPGLRGGEAASVGAVS